MSFLSCEEMLAAARSQNISLSEAILRSDLAESRLTEAHSREMMHHLWQVMQATSRDYDPAQRSRSGLSGGDAARVEQAHQEGKSLGGDYLAAVTAEAQNIAHELAANYEVSTHVDTIICMDGLEVIGAYLSEELTKAGIFSLNAHQTIYVITPESSNSGQIIFRDNFQPMIKGKNVLILNGSITTGSTLSKAIESILYYGGTIRGIAAIFSSVDSVASLPVYSIFNAKDIPDYHSYSSTKCPMCQRQQKIDAIVSSYGYSAL